MSPSAPAIKNAKLQFVGALILVLGLLAYEGYPLLSAPPETVEIYGIYEDLVEFTHHRRHGTTKTYYIKVRDLAALVLPINDKEVITRLRKTRFNTMLRLVLEKSPKERWTGKPDKYYRAVAIYSNNRIYDFQDDAQARHRKAYKQLAIVMFILLSLFGLILYNSSKPQPNPPQM